MNTIEDAAPLTDAVKSRIFALCDPAVRAILESSGAPLQFPQTYKEMHIHLSPEFLNRLLPYLEQCKSALRLCTSVERLILQSPKIRPLQISVGDNPEEISDEALLHWRYILSLRNRVVLQLSPQLIAICNRRGLFLDTNFTRRRFGYDRHEMIGRSVYEVMPHLSEIAFLNLRDAFAYPEVPVYRNFKTEVCGYPVRFRAQVIAHADEAISQVTPLDDYPWLKPY